MRILLVALAASLLAPSLAHALGEGVNGFPSWAERVEHEWMNRARCDPQVEMQKCGNNCGEAACYKAATAPLGYSLPLAHAARYHSDEMARQGFFSHPSACTIVPNIDMIYPGQCNGSAACACVGGTKMCNPMCTDPFARMSLFGAQGSGEIIASPTDPDQAFYLWLYEPSPSMTCAFSQQNGHRWLILTGGPNVGVGVGFSNSTGDFGGPGMTGKIPSGSHYPRQANTIEAWANWSDAAAPMQALINIDGTCTTMTRKRGSDTNGAWFASVSGVGTGCHRYFFSFKDSAGVTVTYPTTGSLAIGPANNCPDWDIARPATGMGCNCVPACNGKSCGDDGCGGSCGTCMNGQMCTAGVCGGGPMPDMAGTGPKPDGGTSDGGSDSDGGNGNLHGGCGCHLGARGQATPALALLLLALALLRRRR